MSALDREVAAETEMPVEVVAPQGRFATVRRVTSKKQRLAMIVLLLLAGAAIAAPLLPIADPIAQALSDRLLPPFSPDHLLGTDDLGRDVLARSIYGLRISLLAALQATAIGFVLGVPVGLASGHIGGALDSIVTRIFDAIQSVPPLILAMALVAALGRNLTSAMFAIGVVFAPRFYRVSRAVAFSVSRESFIEASRSVGATTRHIIGRHTVPNVLAPITVQLAITLAFGMIAEANLSFLGLGVQPPSASLGSMLKGAMSFRVEDPYLMIIPGVFIAVVVLCLMTCTDALKQMLLRDRSEDG